MAENIVNDEKKGLSSKAKGVIAGSVAAGLTAVVAAVTIVSLTKPDLPNQQQSYSVKISSEFEGFNNSNLTVKGGTKVEELKTMIASPVEGYKVEGLYQDLACTKPYSPETVITENMQVFVRFELEEYTVTAYADTSKTQVLETVTVKHGKDATLTVPTKAADNLAKSYEFAGWTDAMGNPVSLTNIKADTEVFANFVVTEYVEYTVGEIPSNVAVTKGSGETEITVATGDNLHYGDRVKIVYTPSTGHQMKTFAVSGAEAVDGAENWYEITGALAVSYSEEKIAYVVGDLPKQVTILDAENNKVESGATLLYDDIITITYTPTAGYVMTEFEVSGAYPVEGLGAGENKYNVRGNITVTYAEEESQDIEYLNYEEYEDGYMVTGLNDYTIEDIVIPAQYHGKKVYGIKDGDLGSYIPNGAFDHLGKIKTVIIENGVEKIGVGAFAVCENLNKVTIPNSVTSFGYFAFGDCESLVSVTLEEGLIALEEEIFPNCTSLTSITIPSSVTSIFRSAFSGCTGLTSIIVADGNAVYTSRDKSGNEMNCIINKNTKELIIGCSTSVIPDDGSVTIIESSVFSGCTGLTSITIPSSVTSIGNYAFNNCTNLATVIIESTDIYNAAAGIEYNNAGLLLANATTVKVLASADDGSNTYLNNNFIKTTEGDYNVYMTEDQVYNFTLLEGDTYQVDGFKDDITLTELSIPATHNGKAVTSIGSSAFSGCTGLTSITIPEGVTSIGNSAFYNCTGLTEINYNAKNVADLKSSSNVFYNVGASGNGITVTFGEGVETIPANLFYVVIIKDGVSYVSYIPSITRVTIPSSVTSIGFSAFSYCTGLTSITIPSSVTSIGGSAFHGCDKLIELYNLSSLNITAGSSDNGYVGYYAKNIYTSLEQPSKLKNVNGYLMYEDAENNEYYLVGYTGNETTLVLPTTEYNYGIYNCAFLQNTKITNIIIPSSVTSIGNLAFDGCTGLTSITIPSSVTSIGMSAFYNCTGLTNVTIPNSVTSIGSQAFNGCTGLTEINYNAKNVADLTDNSNVFYNAGTAGGGITVTFGEGVETIPANLFRNSKITSVTIPSSVTSIGSYAFYGCTGLTSITISEGVTSIGSQAFYGCYKLIEVYNLSSLNITAGSYDNGYVGYYAKNIYTATEGASKLKNVNGCIMYEDAENSEYYLMGYTGDETTLVLPTTEYNYEIYPRAFYQNANITSVTIPEGVTSIGSWVFSDCTGLTNITISSSVTSIGGYAFFGCTKLTTVIIESADIYKSATRTSYAGYLLNKATMVKVLASADDGTNTYLNNNFDKTTETVDDKVYNVYTKK